MKIRVRTASQAAATANIALQREDAAEEMNERAEQGAQQDMARDSSTADTPGAQPAPGESNPREMLNRDIIAMCRTRGNQLRALIIRFSIL